MASLAIEFEQRKHRQNDGVRDLKAICLRYGGPDGSDWGELLAWIEGELLVSAKVEFDSSIGPPGMVDGKLTGGRITKNADDPEGAVDIEAGSFDFDEVTIT